MQQSFIQFKIRKLLFSLLCFAMAFRRSIVLKTTKPLSLLTESNRSGYENVIIYII
jgi:hypothetical protein